MKSFMDNDFLLENDTAKHLYHDYAESMPILDYHCHLSPKEIAEDRQFENITQIWLGGDHYKWRLMRSNGVDEAYITGDASDREKFQKFAETLENAIGNPMVHWSHLELKKYFGYDGVLNGETAEDVWNLANEVLAKKSAWDFIRESNVRLVCTTDDPADSLEYHAQIAQDPAFDVQIIPAWRPDAVYKIEKQGWNDYVKRLADSAGMPIESFADLLQALDRRLDFFVSMGTKATDHGIDYMVFEPASDAELEAIFQKARRNESLSRKEQEQYKTALLLHLAKQYAKRDLVMEIHYGAIRDNNTKMFETLGPDTGYDSIGSYTPIEPVSRFLDALEKEDALPKTILYSLNPNDDAPIGTLLGAFQNSDAQGKIQQGSAWWFNDNKQGMIDQMTRLANLSVLGNFVGMLTDSRSFLSYTRHEYFRRILANLLGGWVENGEYPNDEKALKKLMENISYNNAVRYFGFDLEEAHV